MTLMRIAHISAWKSSSDGTNAWQVRGRPALVVFAKSTALPGHAGPRDFQTPGLYKGRKLVKAMASSSADE